MTPLSQLSQDQANEIEIKRIQTNLGNYKIVIDGMTSHLKDLVLASQPFPPDDQEFAHKPEHTKQEEEHERKHTLCEA